MKHIPNILSICRIVFSVTLFFIKPFSLLCYIIYAVCIISDMLDGYIARKTNSASDFGAKLDTVGDMMMMAALLFLLFPVVHLSQGIIYWIIAIVVIRVISIVITYIKFKTFAMLHTLGNKAAGAIIFLVPFLILVIPVEVLAYFCCLVAGISALEELLIQIQSKKLDLNRKSIFYKGI